MITFFYLKILRLGLIKLFRFFQVQEQENMFSIFVFQFIIIILYVFFLSNFLYVVLYIYVFNAKTYYK